MCSLEAVGDRALFLTCTGGYIQAQDTGVFCVGQAREEGESAASCSML